MRRGLSTGKPTKREAERIVAVKEGPCVACYVWFGMRYGPDMIGGGNDAHHLLSGGIRLGHRYTLGLCPWHHRAVASEQVPASVLRHASGPSLMDGSRLFHEAYGSDDELLAIQDELIGWADE